MTPITNIELMRMSLIPVKRALKRWYIRMQIKSTDMHMDILDKNIRNDTEALRILTVEKVNLNSRLRSLL